MDILFSPYNVGGMPKSAMAEIERRTEELLKSSSFQRMLELEKKYKMERARGPQPLLPSSQLPAQLQDSPPPRPARPDAPFPHEEFLMVKATRRTIIPPPLFITIPQAADNEQRSRQSEWEAEQEDEEYADVGTPTNSEPFQKQVKFLAPEDDNDEEDRRSEQSSICQSPSWEGYGQRKKDKRLEAERRKREKEQAEKEVKAAKKRNTARLSKAPPPPPPPVTASRDSRVVGLTTADRSMSDPLLVTRDLLKSTQSMHRPEDVARAASADDLQQSRWHQLAVTEVLAGPGSNSYRRVGGGTMEDTSYDNAPAPRQELRRSMSEGPALLTQQPSPTFPAKHDSRSPRDAFPPSASRTPRLRHMSPSGGNRSNGPFQGTPSANSSQESLSATPTADGARRNGYVTYQRAQAAERAMAGLADEQLIGNVGQYYPPSRPSSGQTQHTRRPSLSQEAKSAAMKLVGIKTPLSAKDGASQVDYLTFKAIPYSSSSIDTSASVGSMPTSPRSADGFFQAHDDGRASTSEAGTPSSDPSVSGSAHSTNSKKSRSLKDAAKAALSMSKASQKPNEGPKPSVSVPPYFAIRSRMLSRTSVRSEKSSQAAVEAAPENPISATSVASRQAKPTEMGPQGNSRASEGSSSSSAYEDGSSLASPTTTPDTSRPQSAKDIPLSASELTNEKPESPGLQDDERTLRQSSESSTPRMGDSEARERIGMGDEDRWSRTALPIDIDCDAQSFTTTVSNFDNVDNADQVSSKSPPSSPHAQTEEPEPLKPLSKINIPTEDAEAAILIPPRSRKRGQTTPNGSPVSPPAEQRTTQDTMEESPKSRGSRNYARPFEQGERKEGMPERYRKKSQQRQTRAQEYEVAVEPQGQRDEDGDQTAPGSPQYDWTSGSISSASSTLPSAGSTSPHALASGFQMPSNPYFADIPEPLKYHGGLGEIPTSMGPPSPISLPSPLHQVPTKPSAPPRANSAPALSLTSAAASRTSTPFARPSSGPAPVSILKQPKAPAPDHQSPAAAVRPPAVLSALPKHMQLQAGMPSAARAAAAAAAGTTRMAPIAKMFVECCSCKFYHDMPSKLYECMAKPDAVVEDRLLGISGAITTMVKCPWCQHNMSRNCCAGYAAVVYLKEKLH
ncbi:hypothetical protein C8A00DRAFT_11344 [Chaetomidium leptoderma]|uniref:Uncharacterized protein n=1 Tax=Chaetomidium leptoderma TaxID=669021 RepID=A0AAN6VVZ5_9PEZI|nr:hypothetical protein C8A00DRAFT_11344 [Chaetomidium leptoderma]